MAPKRKGKKGSKLARMNDEERARYLQHRAELELEAKRRKQQLIAVFTKNKLKHEEAFSRLNTAKINEQWRFILRQIKCKELYQDVQNLRDNFNRIMKTKDIIIQRLYDDLEVADMDHRKLQEAHIQIIDQIIGKYKVGLICMHSNYQTELLKIENHEVVNLNSLKEDMEQECKNIETITKRQEKTIDDTLNKTRALNAVNIYNIEYLKNETISNLVRTAYTEMEGLWGQLHETVLEYESATEAKRKQYEYLKQQDDVCQLETAQYPSTHSQLLNVIKSLKDNIETLSYKRGQSISELKNQSQKLTDKFWRLRREFSENQSIDTAQLKRLSVISNVTIKELQKASEKGAALVSLIKLCSTLESELLVIKKYSFCEPETVEDQSALQTSEPFNKLHQFWKKYNHTKADNILMKNEVKKLSLENQQLRHALRNYLVNASRTPDARPFTSISV